MRQEPLWQRKTPRLVLGRKRHELPLPAVEHEFDAVHAPAVGFLAGHKVHVARCLVDPTETPWVEHDGQRMKLRPVDPVANAKRKRTRRAKRGLDAIAFDPPGALLRKHVALKNGGAV